MITIGDDYKIESDKYQYILHKRHKSDHEKAKAEYVWTTTYHATIKQCCNAVADSELRKAIQSGIVDEFAKSVDRLCLSVSQ